MEKHRHDYQKFGNELICSCGKRKLAFEPTETPGIVVGIKSDGNKYTLRQNKMRYLFPDEWRRFEATFKNEKHLLLYYTLLFTGARIMEAIHLKPSSFNFDRETVNYTVVKQRKAKKQYYATKRGREFFVSPVYLKKVKRYIVKNKIDDDQYLFLDNSKLPINYDSLENKEKKKYYETTKTGYSKMFKRKVIAAGIKNSHELALHNLRKTYGSVMRTFQMEIAEICYRLGNDPATFMDHYGSSLIFTRDEILEWQRIFGKVK